MSWREEIKKAFNPDKNIHTHNVIFLWGDNINNRTYANYRHPICELYQAVIAEFEKDFDIIAYYTDQIFNGQKKKGLNFYKGKEFYIDLCDNPPESSKMIKVSTDEDNPYLQFCHDEYNSALINGYEEGKSDRLVPDATFYENDPCQMVENLNDYLFTQREKRGLIIFDGWHYWGDEVLYTHQDSRTSPRREMLSIFRHWGNSRTLLENDHLVIIITKDNPLEEVDQYTHQIHSEEYVRECFAEGNKCISINVNQITEGELLNAIMAAHFHSSFNFLYEAEDELHDLASIIYESNEFKERGVEILLDLGTIGGAWDSQRIQDFYDWKTDEDLVTFDDVIGFDELKRELLSKVSGDSSILENVYQYMGRVESIRRGVIFAGPGGCGKSFIGKALAGTLRKKYGRSWKIYEIEAATDITSKYHSESEERINNTFKKIQDLKKAIILWDECESYLTGAASLTGHSVEKQENRTRSAILRGVEKLIEKMDRDEECQYFWVLTTNNPAIIDGANKRRFSQDEIYYIGLPEFKTRKKVINYFVEKKSLKGWSGELIDFVAKNTRGVSMDSLSNLVISKVHTWIAKMVQEQKLALPEGLDNLKIDYKRLAKFLNNEIPRSEGTPDYNEVLENCKRAKCLNMKHLLT